MALLIVSIDGAVMNLQLNKDRAITNAEDTHSEDTAVFQNRHLTISNKM